MKKSIMLSSFIMLIILFVTLSTTTFAWYQAQAGEISISAESTASVTTTGPDSPYLIISTSNSINNADESSFLENGGIKAAYKTIDFISSYTLSLYSVEAANVFAGNSAYRDIIGELGQPVAFDFYLKNTSESFDLYTGINVYIENSGSTNMADGSFGYCYALTFDNGITNQSSSIVSNVHSLYHLSNGTAQSAVEYKYVSAQSDNRVIVGGGSLVHCTFYLWLDAYKGGTKIHSSANLAELISAEIQNVRIVFDHIEVYVS